MSFWKNLKLWHKVVVVIFALLLLKACTAPKVPMTKLSVDPQSATTPSFTKTSKPKTPKEPLAFQMKQRYGPMTVMFECINPNVPKSGLRMVYRDESGEIAYRGNYRLYIAFTRQGFEPKVNEWSEFDRVVLNNRGELDTAIVQVGVTIADRLKASGNFDVHFAISTSREDAELNITNTIPARQFISAIVLIISKNPCSIYYENK